MKTIMVYPTHESEKGISAYSSNLIDSMHKQEIDISEETFIAGKPFSLFGKISKLLKYDIIHLQHEYNLLGNYGLPYFIVLSKLKKKNLIVTMHTVLSQNQKFEGSKLKTFLRKFLYRLQNKHINKTSNLIIVHAKFFKDILVNEYNIPENKIKVIPHGIIENIKTISKEEAKRELNLSGPVYLIIGGMVVDHGHDIILKQADKIGATILVVANPDGGNDRNLEKVKQFVELNEKIVKDNKFEKYVRFDFQPVSYELWWKYFSASDIILLPYKGGIGSGIFADAMAMKKPVVASDVTYCREIANEYNCIKIAKTDQDFPQTIRIVMKKENYGKICQGCQRYFDENNLTMVAKKYKEIYKNGK